MTGGGPGRPRRPVLIELAAAILIVTGLTGVLSSVDAILRNGGDPAGSAGPASGFLGSLVLAVNLGTVVVGLLVRAGRAWILAVNVVAVALYLELLAATSGTALVFAVLDSVVLVALFRERAWFSWWRRPGSGVPSEPGTGGTGTSAAGTPAANQLDAGADAEESALDAADGEPADDVALEVEEDGRHRRSEEDREGREL